jgi:hypothetical protein
MISLLVSGENPEISMLTISNGTSMGSKIGIICTWKYTVQYQISLMVNNILLPWKVRIVP